MIWNTLYCPPSAFHVCLSYCTAPRNNYHILLFPQTVVLKVLCSSPGFFGIQWKITVTEGMLDNYMRTVQRRTFIPNSIDPEIIREVSAGHTETPSTWGGPPSIRSAGHTETPSTGGGAPSIRSAGHTETPSTWGGAPSIRSAGHTETPSTWGGAPSIRSAGHTETPSIGGGAPLYDQQVTLRRRLHGVGPLYTISRSH